MNTNTTDTFSMDDLIPIREAADILGLCTKTIKNYMDGGRLTKVRVGNPARGRLMVVRSELSALIHTEERGERRE